MLVTALTTCVTIPAIINFLMNIINFENGIIQCSSTIQHIILGIYSNLVDIIVISLVKMGC